MRAPASSARRALWWAVTLAFLGLFAWQYASAPEGAVARLAGLDYRSYMDATRSWLAGDGWYLSRQLHGPYGVTPGDVLYPPTWLLLFVPASLVPWPAWWAIPIGVTAWAIVRHHPSPLGWATIAAFLAWPPTAGQLLTGNPGLWLVAALAVATHRRAAAALLLTKVTIAPLALFGVRDREWWRVAAAIVGLSLLFLPMWPDYIRVLLDARDRAGILYSAQDLPMMLIPLVAWSTRSGRDVAGTASPA